MKKRSRTPTKFGTNTLSLMGSGTGSFAMTNIRVHSEQRLRTRPKREEMDRPGDEPGLTIVSGPQFDTLLELLDNPPKVSAELRREAANRRWK